MEANDGLIEVLSKTKKLLSEHEDNLPLVVKGALLDLEEIYHHRRCFEDYGMMPPLDEAEKALLRENRRLLCFRYYRDRTGIDNIQSVNNLMEAYLETLKHNTGYLLGEIYRCYEDVRLEFGGNRFATVDEIEAGVIEKLDQLKNDQVRGYCQKPKLQKLLVRINDFKSLAFEETSI